MKSVGAVLVAMLVVAVGCATPDVNADDYGAEQDDVVGGKDDSAAKPVGTYELTTPAPGQFTRLTVMTDKTFHRETLVECFAAPCYPLAVDGTYKFTASGATKYIKFTAEDGTVLDKYAYKMSGSKLKLRLVGDTTWFTMPKATAGWCAAADDCGLQSLSHGSCSGAWDCSSNTCSYVCGADSACAAAGGECVGLSPSSCPDGEMTGKYACGPAGAIGTTCCMPRPLCEPVCAHVGTASEGWYNSCSDEVVCKTKCGTDTAFCDQAGSRSEGWYARSGHGCAGATLIDWEVCSE